ncbi:class 5 chitinase 1 [Nemania sp. NC0429]|nr:class 5 chitinase 1 [Nemania sp. NC0429]
MEIIMSCLVMMMAMGMFSVGAEFISSLSRCPSPCQASGAGSVAWTYYHDLRVLKTCDETIVFETNLYNAFDDAKSHTSFRACTVQNNAVEAPDFVQVLPRQDVNKTGPNPQNQSPVEALSWGQTASDVENTSISAAFADLKGLLVKKSDLSALFASRRNVVIGLYVGPGIDIGSVTEVVDAFAHATGPFQPRRALQWCGGASGSAESQSFGLILDTRGDVSAIQSALATWAAGKCLQENQGDKSWWPTSLPSISTTFGSSNSSTHARGLPTDGNCYAYTVMAQDTCASIAEAHQMKVSGIEDNNNQTWGWMGCQDLQIGQNICLSTGTPPFPVSVPNSVCGPQVEGTTPTSDPSTWSDLNPCLLNACCDIWGQCGITSEFCTADPADTGAPGTAQPGSNGCISNCGTDIVISAAPDSFARIGYFEAWNTQRPCLNMWPQSIPAYYTHVHFAFANISDDYKVDVSAVDDMFKQFKAKTGFKHILSFGGWAFSTSPETYPIFRQGVTPEQRQTFADNVAQFIMDSGMDGVDFDWEYPGAPDIPGIPPGSPDDGANYLDFLKRVRAALPAQYSISIAAPASYWYLKGFPISDISDVVDYIIYMTYDLHGQWDYGSHFSDPGCPDGSCLRSHINRTETQQSFSMITKAGVPSHKIMVGLPLYGRSFQMTQAGCYTELCTFTGPDSGAAKGKCTDTAGYISNWEIQQVLETPGNDAEQYFSTDAGDIIVYDGTQYISYMTTATYNSRLQWAQSLNFGGVSDWAMDLETSYYGNGSEVGTGSGVVYIDPSILTEPDATISCEPPCTFVLPPWTLSETTVISRPPITETLLNIYRSVRTLTDGVTSVVYVSVTTVTTITLPPLTTDKISLWNVEWTDEDETIITFTSSVVFPPITLTESSDVVTTGTEPTTLTGITYTYSPGPYPEPNPTTKPGPPPGPPPPGMIGSVHVTKGEPGPTCVSGCGSLCGFNCHPSLPCIGICGCIGLGCPAGGSCAGPGCGSDPDGDSDSHTKPSCSSAYTVTDCQVDCSVTDFGTSATTACDSTSCVTVEACSTTGFTSTSKTTTFACPWTTAVADAIWTPNDPEALPPVLGGGGEFGYVYITGANVPTPSPSPTRFIDCNYHGPDPDGGVLDRYCVCSGSTFPASTNTRYPGQSCAYTTVPTKTTGISTSKEVVTSGCQVCTYAGLNAECSTIDGCMPDEGYAYRFEIYNIAYWATDGGSKLHHEEKGCGALTGWKWESASPEHYPQVWFNLPLFIKAGCVERAIVSAGGPKLQCDGRGLDIKKRGEEEEGFGGDEVPDPYAVREGRAAITQAASYRPPVSIPAYSYPASLASTPHYTPMVWDGVDEQPVVVTSTFETERIVVITTTVLVTTTSAKEPLATKSPQS